ncbi:hypothetical protein BC826DRAFT_1011692 [Russula brevipes]|nr:hypothetical protein BC826DRAFT_1011692 [Russula brevipes]
MDNTTPLNCQLLLSSELTACFLSAAAASLLIVLRIIAIWNRNRIVMVTVLSIWGIYFAILVQVVVRVRPVWMPAGSMCVARNIELTLINITSTLVTDIALLVMMLAGMLPLRCHGGGMFGLSKLLWKQGVIWLLLATAVEVPPVVFIALDLNYPLNLISQAPSLIIMTIAGSRMHRQLVDFASASTDIVNDDVPQISLKLSNIEQARTPQTPLNRKDVTIIPIFGQLLTPHMDDGESDISTNGQVHEKAIGFSLDNDVERGT